MSFLLLQNRNNGLVRPGLAAFYDFEKRNLLQRSEEFGNTVWGAGSVTSDAAISPRGDQTADQLSDASAVAASAFVQPVPVQSSAATYTMSLFVKKVQDETRFPEIRVQPQGGTSQPLTAGQLNTKTGAYQIRAGSGSMMVSDEGGYWRVSVSETDTASGNTQVECSILPAFTDALGAAENAELTGSVIVWGAQFNHGGTALTYEKTDNNQTLFDVSGHVKHGQLGLTTGADTNDPLWTNRRLTFSGVDDYLLTPSEVTSGATALTLQIVFKKTIGSATSVQRALFGHNAGGSYIRFFSDSIVGIWLAASVSGQFVQGPAGGITDDGLWKMMTFRWRSGTVQDQFLNKSNRLVFNESSPPDGTHSSTYRAIGMYDNSRYFDGEIASALLYWKLLTRAEVAQNYRWLKSNLAGRGITLP